MVGKNSGKERFFSMSSSLEDYRGGLGGDHWFVSLSEFQAISKKIKFKILGGHILGSTGLFLWRKR